MYRLILDECRGCRGEISTPRSAQPFISTNGRDSQCYDENVDDMANMSVLSVYHPDIIEYIEAKSKDENRLRHFNLSVIVDDAFMDAVLNNKEITLHWPIYDKNGNELPESEWDKQFNENVNAKELWDKIIESAYNTGEPGVLMGSTMKHMNPAYYVENIIGTNPLTNK